MFLPYPISTSFPPFTPFPSPSRYKEGVLSDLDTPVKVLSDPDTPVLSDLDTPVKELSDPDTPVKMLADLDTPVLSDLDTPVKLEGTFPQ